MKSLLSSIAFCVFATLSFGQNVMTPELLWQLGRVGGLGISDDGKTVLYSVTHYDAAENTSSRTTYSIPLDGGEAVEIDRRLQEIWRQHKNYHFISHEPSFFEKLRKGLMCIREILANR